ncbi:MAG: TIGR04104 family putative zinc finger protein [Bacillaceae bacterium]
MKCNNCQYEISFKEKTKLSMKNMYKITCPNCGIKLKMTPLSRFMYALLLLVVIIVNANLLRNMNGTNVIFALILILFAVFFVQPLIANYEKE